MRKLILILSFYFPFLLSGQNVDSVALKRVDSLIQVLRALTNNRDFVKALEVATTVEKLALSKFGRLSAAYGNVCHNYGRMMLNKGDYPGAEKWTTEATVIREKVLGKEHLNYAYSINNLAIVYINTHRYKLAEPLLLQNRAIIAKVLGKEHAEYIASLNSLIYLYDVTGDYEKEEPILLESRDILSKTLGTQHNDYAWSLHYLANFYRTTGAYQKAEPLYLEANIIHEKALSKEHPDFAAGLNDLGILYWKMGNYDKAELLYLESKAIREKVLGKANPDYAHSLNNLAILYTEMGNYEKAETYYLESKEIREKTLGRENPEYAWSLINLAILYEKMNRLDKAELLYLEAKAIREKTLGKEHPAYFNSLDNLAVLYSLTGKYDKAEQFYLEAINGLRKVLGNEHIEYTTALNNLATLYKDLGQYQKAEPLLREVKTVREKIFGKTHTKYVSVVDNLAHLYWAKGDFNMAKTYLLETNETTKSLLTQASKHLSEQELSGYINQFYDRLARFYSFTQLHPELAASSYNNALYYKGFLLNAVSQINNLALSNASTAEKYKAFKSHNNLLVAEYTKPVVERQNILALEAETNALEKELTRNVASFGQAIRQVHWPEVQQKLKSGEAAIEFVHYQFVNPNPRDSIMYAALVLRAGAHEPTFVKLFEKKQLDTLLLKTSKTKADYINQFYSNNKTGKSLYDLIWKPLENALNGVNRIYFSPTGLLNRLNIASIPLPQQQITEKTERLTDRYELIELGSTRQLVLNPIKSVLKTPIDAQLYGGIQYELDSAVVRATNNSGIKNTLASSRGFSIENIDSTLRGGKWNYLKWTEVEVDALEPMLIDAGLKAGIYKGTAATEETFKQIGTSQASPRVIHLATHGFFFPDPKLKKNTAPDAEKTSVFKLNDHPMIRSGIILAGGNYAWQNGKPFSPNQEDGILTAYEISQMNLSNTELVVLSACETGLGDIQGNEGVYGLQRAFKIAGAKYLIMSLWQVPDFQTQELMTTFYSKWLDDKMNIRDAFRAAQNVMKNKYKEPFYWAGFVLIE